MSREEFLLNGINNLEAKNSKLTKEIAKLNKEILDLNKKFNDLTYVDENTVLKEFLLNGIDNEYEISKASYVCKHSNKETKKFHFEDFNDYNINNNIIQDFELVGINVTKIEIDVQGREIWAKDIDPRFSPQLIKYRPFKHGLLFMHAHIVIKVTADYVTEFRVTEKKLPNNILAEIRDKYIMVKYNGKYNTFKDYTWVTTPAFLDLSDSIILS